MNTQYKICKNTCDRSPNLGHSMWCWLEADQLSHTNHDINHARTSLQSSGGFWEAQEADAADEEGEKAGEGAVGGAAGVCQSLSATGACCCSRSCPPVLRLEFQLACDDKLRTLDALCGWDPCASWAKLAARSLLPRPTPTKEPVWLVRRLRRMRMYRVFLLAAQQRSCRIHLRGHLPPKDSTVLESYARLSLLTPSA